MTTMEPMIEPDAPAPEATEALDTPVTESTPDRPGKQVTSVGKALRLLEAFRGITPPVGVSELARRSGLPKSTAFRFLADLEQVGFVERDGSDYRLGMSLFELGSRVNICRPNGLRDTAMPHMSRLHVATNLSSHLAVLEGSEVVHVAKVNHGLQTLRLHLQPGSRIPATCSALGKAILAFSGRDVVREVVESGLPRRTPYSITEIPRLVAELKAIRQNGVAVEREESTVGTVALAAPVLSEGRVVAAVGVTMAAPVSNTARTSAHVRTAAQAISREHEAWAAEIW